MPDTPAQPVNIGVRMQPQQTTQWCWLAVATSIAHFYGCSDAVDQALTMTKIGHEINKWPIETDCWPSAAIHAANPGLATNLADPFSPAAQFALENVGLPAVCIKSGGVSDPLRVNKNFAGYRNTMSQAELAAELEAGRPVAVDVLWDTGGAHVVAVVGELNGDLLILDPAAGETVIAFEDFPAAYGSGAKLGGWTLTKPRDSLGDPLGDPFAIPNADRRIELFAVGSSGTLYHCWQTELNGPFSEWLPMRGEHRKPFVIANQDGRLEVFTVAPGDGVSHCRQREPNGPFADWHPLGGRVKSVFAIHNADRRIELLAVGTDNAVYHRWQTAPNGPFADWHPLGGRVKSVFAIHNADRRIELLAVGTDNAVYHRWQTAPNGPFADWQFVSAGLSDIFATHNADGRIELFAVSAEGTLSHCWQTALNGPFSEWSELAY